VLVILLTLGFGRAGAGEFLSQTINIPTKTTPWRGWSMAGFADVDGDGFKDLLAVGPAEKRLWIFRQRKSGFPAVPDQSLELPGQTAWIALRDVDPHPGVELLVSTASGLVYFIQDHGVFAPEPRSLVQAQQVFTGNTPPILLLPDGRRGWTNDSLPVISTDQATLYRRTDDFNWRPGEPLPLQLAGGAWFIRSGQWMMAGNPSRSLQARQRFGIRSQDDPEMKPENEAIGKILQELKGRDAWQTHAQAADISGAGRRDLVIWQLTGNLDMKTEVLVFLRGADDRLPERPSQVLHCRGFPIAARPDADPVPMYDLDGDGKCELILAEIKITVSSWSSVLDTILTHGVDLALTIRSFKRGAYPSLPEASIPITMMLSFQQQLHTFFFFEGDFNGDGRRDMLVRHSASQWDLFLGSVKGNWFTPKPVQSFEIPIEGDFEASDLNGDGISDLMVYATDKPQVLILLSQSPQTNKR
jgi:hypothetical protein